MAITSFNNSIDMAGPWQLSLSDLSGLDAVIDLELQRLEAYREKQLSEQIEEYRKQYPQKEGRQDAIGDLREKLASIHDLTKVNRRLSIAVSNGDRVEIATFAEARRLQAVEEMKVTSFDIRLSTGRVNCSISMLKSGGLTIECSPPDSHIAREVYISMKQWAQDHQPATLLRIWRMGVWSLGAAALVQLIFFTLRLTSVTSHTPDYRQAARGLLEGGLTADEQLRATELVLKVVTKFGETTERTHMSGRELFWQIIITAILLLSLRAPPNVIGIGKGAADLAFWRWWQRGVVLGIPAFVAIAIIENLVQSLGPRV